MKCKLSHIKAAISLLAAFIIFMAPMPAMSSQSNRTINNMRNSFNSPDFAFPEKVIKNAERELNNPSSDVNLVKALVQLVIANTEKDEERASSLAAKIDSIASEREGCIAAILYSLEAQLVKDVYERNWRANSRQLPLDSPFPENMSEWSGDMFRLKIIDLCHKSLENPSLLKSSPIQDWQGIINDFNEDQIVLCPDLYVFLAERSQNILSAIASSTVSVIPFFGNSSKYLSPAEQAFIFKKDIEKNLLEYARSIRNPLLVARYLTDSPSENPQKYFDTLQEAYKNYSDLEESYQLLLDLSHFLRGHIFKNTSEKEDGFKLCENRSILLEELNEYLQKFPMSRYSNSVHNCLTLLEFGYVTINGKSTYRSDTPVQMDVISKFVKEEGFLKLFRINPQDRNIYLKELLKHTDTELVAVKEIAGQSHICGEDTVRIDFGKLPLGDYAVVYSTLGGNNKKILPNDSQAYYFRISDLGYISLQDIYNDGNDGVYILNNKNGAPIENVNVTYEFYYYGKDLTGKSVTDKDGFAVLPEEGRKSWRASFKANIDGDTLSDNISTSVRQYNDSKSIANIYTDLALYHPGDTVRFAVIAYNPQRGGGKPLCDKKLRIELRNASYESVDTLVITTDDYGRASGEFVVPQNCMRGTFSIYVYDGNKTMGSNYFEIADYVAPKFFIEVSSPTKQYRPNDIVKIEGRAMTFSGMPVTDAKVKLNVQFRPDWFRRIFGEYGTTFNTDLTTDSEGKFSIELPTDSLGEIYTQGIFTFNAVATASSGETQQSESSFFYLGNSSNLSLEGPSLIEVIDNRLNLKAEVTDAEGKPQKTKLDYTLKEKATGKIIEEGSFESPFLSINTDSVGSGEYVWTVAIPESEVSKTKTITLFRKDDKCPPYETALWVPNKEYIVTDGNKDLDITIGSSFEDQNILLVLCDDKGIIEKRWLNLSGENVSCKVATPGQGECRFVKFTAMRDGLTSSETVKIVSKELTENLKCEVLTFRDKITSGGTENWKFKYRLGDRKVSMMPVLATMTDKSLNSIVPFEWEKLTSYGYSPAVNLSGSNYFRNSAYVTIEGTLLPDSPAISFPELDTYGKALLSYPHVVMYKMAESRSLAAPMARGSVMDSEIEEESATMDDLAMNGFEEGHSVETSGTTDEELQKNIKEEYRETECPVAFFMPNLLTNDDGVAEIDFKAPDFNTTWVLQMLAYNPFNLKSNVTTLETVASKKVMVQSQLPRFLRTGDETVLTFTAFNNSESEEEISLVAEVLNPLTNEVIVAKTYHPKKVNEQESFVETLGFTAPSDMESVKVRVMARMGVYSDGEQSLIGILPSSTPVTESTPFFLAPDVTDYTLTYPEMQEGSQAMFSYCDNPVWYCVTALPDMTFPKDASILTTLRHLYGNSIAFGLIKQYPQIGEAVKLWSESNDSTLVSPLQRNELMKILDLEATPWTLNAESETLRMSRLVQLLDKERCEIAIKDALEEILNKQNFDGSWSWCDGMTPSPFITGRILLYLSMLRQMNYLPDNSGINEMIKKAISYCDQTFYSNYLRNKKTFSTSTMLNYLYVRSGFKDVAMTSDFAELKAKTLNAIIKEWRDFSIYDAAVAAIVLNRNGKTGEAFLILESLQQKSLSTPERGMWFANLNSSWYGRNMLITTMQVLEAYKEVSPAAPQIDQLRQWLLIQRQTQDWGNSDEIAEVVYAILTSGSDWTAEYVPASFSINGKEIEVNKRDALTGSFTMPLDISGGTIEITKSAGHQSWGGVVSRRILPIQEVKPFSESDIKITKRLLRVIEDESGRRTEEIKEGDKLRLGDKVRVQLMIASERGMDYVSITDGRSACLSPIQQLSGYVWQDGSGYYRDVQTDHTNLFFDFLKKGITYAEYDCYVSQEGMYSVGIAQIQCLYAPLQTAHSGASTLTVK